VGTIYALEAAVDEFLADGHEARVAMYAARNRALRGGLRRLGMASFTSTGNESHSIVTARLPLGFRFEDLYEPLKDRGFVIYDCKAPLQGQWFQIANMGYLDPGAIDQFLAVFATFISAAEARPVQHARAGAARF
jgi:2-aminoethylphosphonate-pyruvate transaminase